MKKTLLLAALLSLCLVSCGKNNNNENNNEQVNPVPGGIDLSKGDYNGYYDNILNKQGEELVSGLNTLMSNYEFISYSSLGPAYVKTDSMKDDNGELKMVDFYTHKLMKIPSDQGFQGAYNREHVWPRYHFTGASNSSEAKKMKANSDLHHVRPNFYDLNGYRANTKFAKIPGKPETGFKQSYGTGSFDTKCYKSGDVFEPSDISKGDCARICVYVAVTHNFNIQDIFAGDKQTVKETLLEWNSIDPVDDIEIKRNNEAYKIQHNRNAFIDSSYLFQQVVTELLS